MVYSTKNCGETWTPRVVSVQNGGTSSTITGDDIVTAGYAGNSDFTPTNNTQWREASFSYSPTTQDRMTRFKFEFTASDLASNAGYTLAIEGCNEVIDMTITRPSCQSFDTLIVDIEYSGVMDLFRLPNGEAINISFTAQNLSTMFTLRDVNGKIISEEIIETTNAEVSQKLNNTENLNSGCYFLEVKSGDFITTKKVVVL